MVNFEQLPFECLFQTDDPDVFQLILTIPVPAGIRAADPGINQNSGTKTTEVSTQMVASSETEATVQQFSIELTRPSGFENIIIQTLNSAGGKIAENKKLYSQSTIPV